MLKRFLSKNNKEIDDNRVTGNFHIFPCWCVQVIAVISGSTAFCLAVSHQTQTSFNQHPCWLIVHFLCLIFQQKSLWMWCCIQQTLKSCAAEFPWTHQQGRVSRKSPVFRQCISVTNITQKCSCMMDVRRWITWLCNCEVGNTFKMTHVNTILYSSIYVDLLVFSVEK